jgi:Bacterial membrane protein YfhO
MIVIRSIAVYVVSTGAALLLVRRHLFRLSWPIVVFLVFSPWLITGRAMLTGAVYAPLDIAYQAPPLSELRPEQGIKGTKTPILGDVVYQEIPWRKAVRDAVKNGRLPLWNRFILAGEPLLAMQQPAVFHPSTVIGMLLPLAQAWTFEMTFTLFLALLCGWLFCRDLGLSPAACCVGAAGWAFSDYLLFHLGYPLSPSVAPFPLLLVGLSRIAKEQTTRSLGITVVALLLVLTAGHSETLLHVVAASGIYFLFCLFSIDSHKRVRAVLLSAKAGAIAVAIGAIVLLPHLEALPHTFEYFFRKTWYATADHSLSISQAVTRLPQLAMPYAFGSSGHGSTTEGQNPSVGYIGSVLLPLAVFGLFSHRREKWALILLGLLGIALWAALPGITDVIFALPLFKIALNSRLIFLASFSFAILAALGTESMVAGGARWKPIPAVVGTLLLITVGYFLLKGRLLALRMPPPYLQLQFLLQFLPLCLLTVWVLAAAGHVKKTAAVVLGLVLMQRAAEGSLLYPVIPSRAFYPPLEVLKKIPRDQPYRTSAIGFSFIPNISALYELEDVRGYEAMTFQRLHETYPLWCIPQPVWFNRIDDPARPFLSFLNVRYFLIPDGATVPSEWSTLAEGSGVRLVENPKVLPRAFAPSMFRVEPESGEQLKVLGEIEDFARLGVVGELAGQSTGVWIPNGEASVRILSYTPDGLSFRVAASQPALVGTSVTAWPGWRLKIDGKRARLIDYNHAFLSFVVPPGEHRAELRYLPDSFVVGAWVSGLTLLFLTVMGVRRRRPSQGPFQTATVRGPTLPTTR